MISAKWKPGFSTLYHGADAGQVADEIIELGQDVRPEDIVERAKDPTTELHKCFTWDDTEAAKKWRIYEARQIVCHLVTEREAVAESQESGEIRMFYRVNGQGYQPTTYIMRNDDSRQKLLTRALSEFRAAREKYAMLSELEPIFDAIDQAGA